MSVQYQTHTTEINKTLKIDFNYAKAYAYIMKLSMFVWSVKIQRIVLRETKTLKSTDKHNEITFAGVRILPVGNCLARFGGLGLQKTVTRF